MTLPLPSWSALSLLIVDDEPGMRSFLCKALARRFAQIEVAASVEEAEALRSRMHFDLIIADIRLPGRSGIEWHESLQPEERRSDLIFMTGFGDMESALRALRLGASDFILKPFNLEQMVQSVDRVIARRRLERENWLLRQEVSKHFPMQLIGDSANTRELKTLIARVAPSPAAVLVEGESGTGKELVARALHQLSGRSGAFVPVNCAAIAPELLESELFGHLQGAFTGARKGRDGLFREAHQGTLFLDEIGEMPLAMQSSLLRALEQKAIRPVGGERELPVDVRIVAATNRNLKAEVEAGRFRADLYYRLNVVTLRVAPLRERPEDIPALVHHFTTRLTAEMGMEPLHWTHEDVAAMQGHDWPGNVRELRNLIERSLLLGKPPTLEWQSPVRSEGGYPDEWDLARVERAHIEQVVACCDGNKSAAARILGVARKTLERKFKEWESC
ncbi:sigma-54 dependent transcriptional regulator [Aeromonas schubertii]|uniref:Sigma-54 dependent transcriptional regulator n=1 Tax=Aeromonas schubertii TaxID=652 RepID=A0ABS7V825_9GAMM|nr:sigma-54 dependent transcriptional regulator [Aeromonas schubertii]MBZ6065235.1 sigma-54 dependent transcriptional regulator [Aeromonas schubertii]